MSIQILRLSLSNLMFMLVAFAIFFGLKFVIDGFSFDSFPRLDLFVVGILLATLILTVIRAVMYVKQTEEMENSPWRFSDTWEVEVDNLMSLATAEVFKEIQQRLPWLESALNDNLIIGRVVDDAPLPPDFEKLPIKTFFVQHLIEIIVFESKITVRSLNPVRPKFLLDYTHKKLQKHFTLLVAEAIKKAAP